MPDGVFCGPCYTCKTEMWLPRALYDAANHGKGKISFYCPYGHGQIFSEGDSPETILRRERDRLKQQLAERDDEIRFERNMKEKAIEAARALKVSATKARKRSIAGTCPCCKRTFRQMALHMKNKHPDFKAEEAA